MLRSHPRTHQLDLPFSPGIRRHIERALAQDTSIEEILEVLKLCGGLGADACELGAPILADELAKMGSSYAGCGPPQARGSRGSGGRHIA